MPNELRSMRPQGCGRIDRALNFSASWERDALAEAIRSVRRDSVSLSGDRVVVTRFSGVTGIPVGAMVSVASDGDVADVTGMAERKP